MVKTDRYIEIKTKKFNCRLIPVTEEIIRCIVSKDEICPDMESLMIEKKEYFPVDFQVEEALQKIVLKTAKVWAEVEPSSGIITWKHPDGTVWLQEKGKDLTQIDVIHYTTGGEKPIINRVKTVDGERNFILNLKEEKDRTAYRARLFFSGKRMRISMVLDRQRKESLTTEVTISTFISIICVFRCLFLRQQKATESW